MFQFPNLENQKALANKSFFKADRVEMHWNKKGIIRISVRIYFYDFLVSEAC